LTEYLTDDDFATAARNGISRRRAYERFYNWGWERERAITQPLQKRGHLWVQYKAKCAEINLSRAGFIGRIDSGMTPEQAATTPKKKTRKDVQDEFNKTV
jgi:hypothetical protein